MKINSALKNRHTNLQIGMTYHIAHAITGIDKTCWLSSIWIPMSLQCCIPQKNVKHTWTASYQNSNDYWCFTSDQKRSGRNTVQTSVIFTVSTQCDSKDVKTKVNYGQIWGAASAVQKCSTFLTWTVSLLNDRPSHLLTDGKKFPHYHILQHMSYTMGSLSVIPHSKTPKANSITAATTMNITT